MFVLTTPRAGWGFRAGRFGKQVLQIRQGWKTCDEQGGLGMNERYTLRDATAAERYEIDPLLPREEAQPMPAGTADRPTGWRFRDGFLGRQVLQVRITRFFPADGMRGIGASAQHDWRDATADDAFHLTPLLQRLQQ